MMSKMAASVSEGNFENFMKILKENVVNIREMCNKYKQNASGLEEFVARSLEKLKRLDDLLHADASCSDLNQDEEDAAQKIEDKENKFDAGAKEVDEGSIKKEDQVKTDEKNVKKVENGVKKIDDAKKKEGKEKEPDKVKPQKSGKKKDRGKGGSNKGEEDKKAVVLETEEPTQEQPENHEEGGEEGETEGGAGEARKTSPESASVESILQLYAQVLLDVTFCEENILVDGIFPEKNSKSRVHKLLGMLRQPEVICQHCFPEKTPKEILGEEVLECLLWRRGALLYMYCHTIQEDSGRLERERTHFIENCKQGALFLKHMLQVRTPLSDDRVQVVTNSEDVFALLKKGLFSDTHVLSLIYTGELCYWHMKHQGAGCLEEPDLDARGLGSGVLHLFLEMVEGPLKDHGWSSQRATQLLEFIEKKPEQLPQS